VPRQRYSIKESWNRILRLFKGQVPNEESDTLDKEVLSDNQAISDYAELLAGSLPGETLTLPESFIGAILDGGFSTGTSLSTQERKISWFIPMTGVTDNQFLVTGENRVQSSNETSSYTTRFSLGNQHLSLYINSLSSGGVVHVSGSFISENTGVPMWGTETITVPSATSYYQTNKKWLEIVSIDTSNLSGEDYDVRIIGYLDMGNRDFTINGYRVEFRSAGNNPDVSILIQKVQDDGSGAMSLVAIENMGIDSTVSGGTITDGIRTDADNRGYTFGSEAWDNNTMFVFKQLDFNTYFTNDENILEGSSKNEGLLISFLGSPSGGISNTDHGTLTLFYTIDD